MKTIVTKLDTKTTYRKPRVTRVGSIEKLTAGPSAHRNEEHGCKGK